MPADLKNAFDVALYFFDRSIDEREHIQPQKLQRLLFFSQGYYLAAFKTKLIPAIFVADELGPIEPNIFVSFSRGRPDIDIETSISNSTQIFLDRIWNKFSVMDTNKLTRLSKENDAYKKAIKRGLRAEIYHSDMLEAFLSASNRPLELSQKPNKLMRNQSGHPVRVRPWMPKTKR